MGPHGNAILRIWLFAGILVGLVAGAMVLRANGLAPPVDENALRLLASTAGAGALQYGLLGLGVAVVLAVFARGRSALETFSLHLTLAAGLLPAVVLLLLSFERFATARGPLVLRGLAIVALLAMPFVWRLLRRTPALAEGIAQSGLGRVLAAVSLVLTTGGLGWVLATAPAPAAKQAASAAELTPEEADAIGRPVFEPLPEVSLASDRGRVFLIGVDGLSWEAVDRVAATGRAPNLARMKREGAHAELGSMIPTWSPRIWNTVFTGRLPEDHGIVDFSIVQFPRLGVAGLEKHRELGAVQPMLGAFDSIHRIPISNLARRTKAIWNLASEAGLEVAVVSAWSTYPAEAVRGSLVTDHAFYRPSDFDELRRVRHKGASNHTRTYPASLNEELAAYELRVDEAGPDTLDRFLHLTDEDRARFTELVAERRSTGHKPRIRMMSWAVLNDRFTRDSTLHLLERGKPDFVFTYYNAFDTFGHMAFELTVPEAPDHQPADEIARFKDCMDEMVVWVDETLGAIAAHADPDTTVVLVSDHGWGREAGEELRYGHQDAPAGVFLATGRGIRPGRFEGPAIVDVAPTVFHLLGLPLSDELEGRVITEALDPTLLEPPPVRIATYDVGKAGTRTIQASGEDEAMLEKLQALGYIE